MSPLSAAKMIMFHSCDVDTVKARRPLYGEEGKNLEEWTNVLRGRSAK